MESEGLTKEDLKLQGEGEESVESKGKGKKPPIPPERENDFLKAKLYEQDQEMNRLRRMLEVAQAEKRKPGLTVVNEEGHQERKKRPNSWGLSDLVMPPYTKGRVAIYRAIGQDQINPATGLIVEPVDVLIPGEYTFYDRFEKDPLKRDKVISNITGTRKVVRNGKTETEDIIEDVVLQRGFLQVFIEKEYPLYVFMELHSMNSDNKFRANNAVKAFERVDINRKSAASQGAALELSLEAGNEVRALSKDDVIAFTMSVHELNASTNRPIHEMRTDLMRWAMNNPIQYYKLNKNAKAAIKINVMDAINFGLIEYQMDKKGYVNTETEEVICSHTPAQDPLEQMVKFLHAKEGEEWYKIILDRMNYWGND